MVRSHIQRKWEVKVSSPRLALCPQAYCLNWPRPNILSVLTDIEVIIYSTIGKPQMNGGLLGNIEKYRLPLVSLPKSSVLEHSFDFNVTSCKTLGDELVKITRTWMDKKATATFEEVFVSQVWNKEGSLVLFLTNLNRVFLCSLEENSLSFNLVRQISEINLNAKPLEGSKPKAACFLEHYDVKLIILAIDSGLVFINYENFSIVKKFDLVFSIERQPVSLLQFNESSLVCGCSDGTLFNFSIHVNQADITIDISVTASLQLELSYPVSRLKKISDTESVAAVGNACCLISMIDFVMKSRVLLAGVITGIDIFKTNNNLLLERVTLIVLTTSSGDITFVNTLNNLKIQNEKVLAENEVTNISEAWHRVDESDVYLEDYSKAQIPIHGIVVSPNEKLLLVLTSQYDPLEIKKNRIFTPKLVLRLLCLESTFDNNTVGTYLMQNNAYPFDILYHLQLTLKSSVLDDLEELKKYPHLLLISSKLNLGKRIFPLEVSKNLTNTVQKHIIGMYLLLCDNFQFNDLLNNTELVKIFHLLNDYIACWEEKGESILLKHERIDFITKHRKKYLKKYFKPVTSNLPYREAFGEGVEANSRIVTDHLKPNYSSILQGVVVLEKVSFRVRRCPLTLLILQDDPFLFCPFCETLYNNWEQISIFSNQKRFCLLCSTKLERARPISISTVPPSDETLNFDS